MLQELRHDRIASLRAVVITPSFRSMIFEYTDLGDLKNFLLSKNPNSDIYSGSPLNGATQLHICLQVCIKSKMAARHLTYYANVHFTQIFISRKCHVAQMSCNPKKWIILKLFFRLQKEWIIYHPASGRTFTAIWRREIF
jgi:hypothetical protein